MKSITTKQLSIVLGLAVLGSNLAAESLRQVLAEIRGRLDRSRHHSSPLMINKERIGLYHYVGSKILALRQTYHLGPSVLNDVAGHLSAAFPEFRCFSVRNLSYMCKFAQKYPDLTATPEVLYVSWAHHRVLIDRVPDTSESLSFLYRALENQWSSCQLRENIDKAWSPFSLYSFSADIESYEPAPEPQGVRWYWYKAVTGLSHLWQRAVLFFYSLIHENEYGI